MALFNKHFSGLPKFPLSLTELFVRAPQTPLVNRPLGIPLYSCTTDTLTDQEVLGNRGVS